ncbi:MAG TPA: helix-turn-helix domain-containing protein [Candidatus Desulfovibrio intestinigallinarum]|nr:helix-turn-helix domain-containing protein [Candidatus Desulfovibrio intestinigallinarum]
MDIKDGIHMELFERIRYLAETKGISLAKIAAHIGESPQTFGKWLTAGSQRNLWAHLPKIEELFPDVRPDWLWRGSGPVFWDGSGEEPQAAVSIANLQQKITELEAELKEERALNRRLTDRLLEMGKN